MKTAETNRTWTCADDPGYPCRDCSHNRDGNCAAGFVECGRYKRWLKGERDRHNNPIPGKLGMWARVREPILKHIERKNKND